MRILIRNRFNVFTHRPGAYVVLPFSQYALHIFPNKIFILDLSQGEMSVAEVDFCLEGPTESFVTELDLEKGSVACHGTVSHKFFRYFIFFDESKCKIVFHLDKPIEGIKERFQIVSDEHSLLRFQERPEALLKKAIPPEKMSFGIFKKLNFENIQDREDMREILPLWHALAKQIPSCKADFGGSSLLADLREEILQKRKENILPLFKALFKTGFQSILFPRLKDNAFQGYQKPPLIAASPLALLTEGAALIRSSLLKYEDNHLALLPLLPKELSSGRVTGFLLQDLALFDCEWRTGKLLGAAFTSFDDADLNLLLPKGIKSFRVRDLKNNVTMRGEIDKPLSLKKDAYTLLDRFIY